jgi:uncharacterized protein (TIGR02996 family)
MFNEREDFLRAIEQRQKENFQDPAIRLVYADWLDERDEADEAERQRKFVEAETWLRKFAVGYFETYCDYKYWILEDLRSGHVPTPEEIVAREFNWKWGGNIGDRDCAFGQLMIMLNATVEKDYYLSYDTPYDIPFSDELWEKYEIFTGIKGPPLDHVDRTEMPSFRCSC